MNAGPVIQKTVPCYEYMLRYDRKMHHVMKVMYAARYVRRIRQVRDVCSVCQ
jgi:hypothetical protein